MVRTENLMKKLCLLSIIFALILLLLVSSPAGAALIAESAEIPYQINNSDRIVIGTVSNIQEYYDYTIFEITVDEWLYNPLPAETVKVRTETGTNVWTEDQAEFELNESVLLMLRDKNQDKELFSVSVGFPGKHPVSDRETVIEELKVQGKWQEENMTENSGTTVKQPIDSDLPPDSESAPFAGILWIIAAIIGITVCSGKQSKH